MSPIPTSDKYALADSRGAEVFCTAEQCLEELRDGETPAGEGMFRDADLPSEAELHALYGEE
jgi:hypothetical protein